MTTVSRLLRDRTQEIHQSTETRLLADADVATVDGLERFHAVMRHAFLRHGAALDLAAVEVGVRPRSGELLDALSSGRRHRIEARLTTQRDHDRRRLAGVAYTLEGSALGAEVLRRRLPPSASSAYLDLLVDGRAARWSRVKAWLDRFDPNDIDVLVDAATETFHDIAIACDETAEETV